MEFVEPEGLDVATYEKKNMIWVFVQEHVLEVLHQHYDRQVAGQ